MPAITPRASTDMTSLSFPMLPKSLRGRGGPPSQEAGKAQKGQSPAEGAQPVTGRGERQPWCVGLQVQSSFQRVGCVGWMESSGFSFFLNIAFSAVSMSFVRSKHN